MKPMLMALLGGGKDKPAVEGESAEPTEKTYAREAFAALKDDDQDGFVEAFLGAVRACKGASDEDYEDEDDVA